MKPVKPQIFVSVMFLAGIFVPSACYFVYLVTFTAGLLSGGLCVFFGLEVIVAAVGLAVLSPLLFFVMVLSVSMLISLRITQHLIAGVVWTYNKMK
jgi:hypothetical protein